MTLNSFLAFSILSGKKVYGYSKNRTDEPAKYIFNSSDIYHITINRIEQSQSSSSLMGKISEILNINGSKPYLEEDIWISLSSNNIRLIDRNIEVNNALNF